MAEQTITMQTTDETDGFDPGKHIRLLSGREYLDVKWRIVWLRRDHPEAIIDTDMTEHRAGEYAVFKAHVTFPNPDGGYVSATGWGSETKQDFHDYLEKAETKAVGRALMHLGYGTASLPDDGERIADTPVERAPVERARDPNPPIGQQRTYSGPHQAAPPQRYPMRDPHEPATPKQVDLIIKIVARKNIDPDVMETYVQGKYGRSLADLTKGNASDLIELIKADSFAGFGGVAAGPDAGDGADPGDELADSRF